MRSLVVLLGFVITFSIAALDVNACTCGGAGTPCESLGSADAVFVGTVVSLRENERPKQPDRSDSGLMPRTFKFSVEQAYLGVVGTEIEISTGYGSADCGYPFKIGQRYLVYADRYKEQLNTSICTGTKSFSDATLDLAFLGTLASAAPGVSIYGTVTQRGLKNETIGYPDVVVTVEGESERKEMRVDSRGSFRVNGLRAGTYKVSVQLPETLTTYQPQREITIADRGCATVTWYVTDNGRISGRVVNQDGEPLDHILVALAEPDANPQKDPIKLERTDEQGRFTFTSVARGRYVIAVNYHRVLDPNDQNNGYQPSFYPGVTDQAQAQVITVGAGEKLNELEVRLSSRRPGSVVSGTVVWADGSPVANAQVIAIDFTKEGSPVPFVIPADEQGRFKIYGYIGQRLMVAARSNRPNAGRPDPNGPVEDSNKVRLILERPAETLRLVITKLR
jgi:Carboxypeptidase regulatory-like domain